MGDPLHPHLDPFPSVEEGDGTPFVGQEVVLGGFRPAESTSLEGPELSPGAAKVDFRLH